jgi:hypothetical protein
VPRLAPVFQERLREVVPVMNFRGGSSKSGLRGPSLRAKELADQDPLRDGSSAGRGDT